MGHGRCRRRTGRSRHRFALPVRRHRVVPLGPFRWHSVFGRFPQCGRSATHAPTPPSTAIACPVRNPGASSHSHSAISAISLASAKRPTGVFDTSRVIARVHRAPEHRSVDGTGADGVHPDALARVLPRGDPGQSHHTVLGRGIGGTVGPARNPATEAQLTIEPPSEAIMPGSGNACRKTCRSGPQR